MMKSMWMSVLLVMGILTVFHFGARAQEVTVASVEQAPSSKTVWVDVSKFGRKNRLSQRLTEEHEKQAAEGWVFADMELYTENSDLEGVFVTYTKTK